MDSTFSERQPTQRITWTLALEILLLGIILATVQSLLPAQSFWCGDQGVKLLQVQNLISSNWRDAAIAYPGEFLDHEHTYSPLLIGFFYETNGKIYAVSSQLFAIISTFCFLWMGYRGLYVGPLLATLGTSLTCYAIATRFSKHALLAPFILTLSTPLFFYGLVFWEHAWGVLFVSLSLLGIVESHISNKRWLLILSGISLGIGVLFRTEIYVWVLATFVAYLLADSWRAVFLDLLFMGAGVGAILVPWWAYQQTTFGSFIGSHVVANFSTNFGGMSWYDYLLHQKAVAWEMLAPWGRTGGILLLLSLIAVGTARLSLRNRMEHRISHALFVFDLLLIGIGIYYTASSLRVRPTDVIGSFPLIFALALKPFTRKRLGPRLRFSLSKFLIVLAALNTILVTMTSINGGGAQWGPRYLLPLYPILTVGITSLVSQLKEGPFVRWQRSMGWSALVLLFVLSVLLQISGLGHLWHSKRWTGEILEVTKLTREQFLITDLWWFPQVVAPVFYDKVIFLARSESQMDGLVQTLLDHGISHFGYVTSVDETRRLLHNTVKEKDHLLKVDDHTVVVGQIVFLSYSVSIASSD